MKITIFGLGYVGAVTGACLANNGNTVNIIEKEIKKVSVLLSGISPITEPGLAELISRNVSSGNLQASNSLDIENFNSDFILVSVGTPSNLISGESDLTAIKAVANQIAKLVLTTEKKIRIALCSTVPPGTTETVFRKILDDAGAKRENYFLSFIPEFLRECQGLSDFQNPSRFIIGAQSKEEASEFLELRPELSEISHLVKTEVAEMLKITENAWHATKITFANEIARICDSYDVEASQIMEILVKDKKQNISAMYLRPGFAFGGSCLPKDLRALNFLASQKNIDVPLIGGIEKSNNKHIENAFLTIDGLSPSKIAILGLAFKANTDDMRESPILELVNKLSRKNYNLQVHDFRIKPEILIGSNKQIWNENPHLNSMFSTNLDEVLRDADLIVIAQHEDMYRNILVKYSSTRIVNLVRL